LAHPPSQDYLVPSDVAVIRECFPLSEALLSPQELCTLVHLGLSDVDVMGCIEHGFGRSSVVSAAQAYDAADVRRANPVDTCFRVAAHMSGVDFERARAQRQLQQQQQHDCDNVYFWCAVCFSWLGEG
jgi:hypothetical protein